MIFLHDVRVSSNLKSELNWISFSLLILARIKIGECSLPPDENANKIRDSSRDNFVVENNDSCFNGKESESHFLDPDVLESSIESQNLSDEISKSYQRRI